MPIQDYQNKQKILTLYCWGAGLGAYGLYTTAYFMSMPLWMSPLGLVGVGLVIGASIIVHKTQSDKFLQSAKDELMISLEQLLKNENLHSSTQKKLTNLKDSIQFKSSLDQLAQYETVKKSQGELSFSIQQFQYNNDALIDDYMALEPSGDPSIHYQNGYQDDLSSN